MIEEWKPVVDFEGLYEVSNLGDIRSLDRYVPVGSSSTKFVKGKILTKHLSNKGRYYVTVSSNAKSRKAFIHREVCLAFHGPSDLWALHRDGNELNNVASNLYWGTQSDNEKDKIKHGRHNHASKKKCSRDHPLEPFNLMQSRLVKGFRECLACGKMWGYSANYKRRTGQKLSKEEQKKIADEYFAIIESENNE